MENTLMQCVADKLLEAERGHLMRAPAKTMSDRTNKLLRRAKAAGFAFEGPVAATKALPNLIVFAQCQGSAEYSDRRFTVEVRCWVDGEVNLVISCGTKQVFWARVYSDEKVAQKFYFDKLPDAINRIPTEKLLTDVEKLVLRKLSQGVTTLISEVYVLTKLGDWVCRPYMVTEAHGCTQNALEVKKIIRSLKERYLLCGVVYVSSGQIVGVKQTQKREALVFNGHGPAGHRVRIYEVKPVAGRMQPSKLIGVFKD